MLCGVCGNKFTAKANNGKYCSRLCCSRAKNKKRESDPRYESMYRKWNLKKNFGITVEEYDEMSKTQKNRCAICGVHQSEVKRRFAVDHDHDTGNIRGLLCLECNRGLGAFDDSSEVLEKAINYLTVTKFK